MTTTREFLRLGALLTTGALLACANDSTAPLTPSPASPQLAGDPVLTFIRIQGDEYPLAPITGKNQTRLEVRAEDQYGVRMTGGGASFSIISENPSVATVSEGAFWSSGFNGVPYDSWLSAYVTAIAPGEAVISVSWTIGGVTKTARTTIRVESTEGWSLKVDPSALTVKLGSAKQLRPAMMNAVGAHKFTPQFVVFTPDRDDMVALYYDELCDWHPCHSINVRGVAVGETTINARLDGFSTTIRVTVVP